MWMTCEYMWITWTSWHELHDINVMTWVTCELHDVTNNEQQDKLHELHERWITWLQWHTDTKGQWKNWHSVKAEGTLWPCTLVLTKNWKTLKTPRKKVHLQQNPAKIQLTDWWFPPAPGSAFLPTSCTRGPWPTATRTSSSQRGTTETRNRCTESQD